MALSWWGLVSTVAAVFTGFGGYYIAGQGRASDEGSRRLGSEPCQKCPGDRYTCEEWIRWDPRKYTCANLESRWGCNCSGCSSCSARPVWNAAALRLFQMKSYPDARCLDGSMAGYYFRRGTANKYLIFLEGGGWCYDSNCVAPTRMGTLLDCRRRAKSNLGSSSFWPQLYDKELIGMLSADPNENPVFHNWTLVYVRYCDGGSFTGNTVIQGLHFRGAAILRALIAELKAQTGIRAAEHVVLSGGSAGASAVYYHVDTVSEQLGLEDGELLGLPDAGFFLDLKDKDHIDCWPAQMRSLYNLTGGYADLHGGCLQRFPHSPWKCLFPENYADLISARLFVLNSLYDSSEITYTLRLDCCPGGCGGSPPVCKGRELQLFEALRQQHIRAWAPLVSKSGNGMWAPACVEHIMACGKWTSPAWEVPAGSGNTMAAVVSRWLSRNNTDGRNFTYQDNAAWPQNRPCSSTVGIQA